MRIVKILLLGIGAFFLLALFLGNEDQGGNRSTDTTHESGALSLCQFAIKRQFESAVDISVPYVGNFGDEKEHYFAWGSGTKHISVTPSGGLEETASASCIVSATTGQIESLSINGQTIF